MDNKEIDAILTTSEDKSAFERILAYSVGEQKAAECAERLIGRYGSLSTVLSECVDEIARVGDFNTSTALLVKLIAYLNSRRITDSFDPTAQSDEISLRSYVSALFLGLSVETVYAILLDNNGRVISAEFISEGTVNSSTLFQEKFLNVRERKNPRTLFWLTITLRVVPSLRRMI